MKNKKYRLYFGTFIMIMIIVMYLLVKYIFNTESTIWQIVSFVGVVIMTVHGLTYEIEINQNGIRIKSPLFPYLNDVVLWAEVKRIKNGVLFKEVEFYSKRRGRIITAQVSGLTSGFSKLHTDIMKKIGQNRIT